MKTKFIICIPQCHPQNARPTLVEDHVENHGGIAKSVQNNEYELSHVTKNVFLYLLYTTRLNIDYILSCHYLNINKIT
jgi:hypothetical protein